MNHIQIEVAEDGNLRIKSPEIKPGDTISLLTKPQVINEGKGKWSQIRKALDKVKDVDYPRRTHEEILHDLHELRG